MNQPKIKRRVGKYEVGRTIGEGTFAKVKFARNSDTGEPVALKIIDKEKVLKHKIAEQIKREIATMKLIQHPNVVRLFEGCHKSMEEYHQLISVFFSQNMLLPSIGFQRDVCMSFIRRC